MDINDSGRNGKPRIAIVVGNAAQRSHIARCLTAFYRFSEYADMPRAMAGCRANTPRLVVVSEQLATSSGFDFVRMLRLDPALMSVPTVMVVDEDDEATRHRVAQCGAGGHVSGAYTQDALITAVSDVLNQRVERGWETLDVVQRQALTGTLDLFNGIADCLGKGEPIAYAAISDACEPLVEAVTNNNFRGILHGVREHDNYTFAHSMRVATYLALFGSNLRLPKDEQIILAGGGLMHDVGKMSIARAVLNKSGRLDAAEFDVMKGHVNASVNYLRTCTNLPNGVLTIASQHHEKLDGTGYPGGLPGSKLNRLARMASIIDVFSALTDRRVYKAAMEAETALQFMVDEMASHLDTKLLGLFRQMLLDATREIPSANAVLV